MDGRPNCRNRTEFSNSYGQGLKSVFKKLRFSDGLVWTVGQTVEISYVFVTD